MFTNMMYLFNKKERGIDMELLRVQINGFRNLKDIDINFKAPVALVSLNNYGKSNILNALDFGIYFINELTSKKKMMMSKGGVPLNKSLSNLNYSIDLELKAKIKDITYVINYGYEFEWIKNNDKGARILNEWMRVKSDEKNQKYNQYILRNTNGCKYKQSHTSRCIKAISIKDDELVINKLKAFDDLFFIDIVKELNNLNIYIERHLDAEDSFIINPYLKKDIDDFDMDESDNIPRVIYQLKKEYPKKYELLLNSYMILFPKIDKIEVFEIKNEQFDEEIPEDVPFTIANELHLLYVKDSNLNQPIPFTCLSDGAKRIFTLLTCMVLADINNLLLIAIEEPENSIHPSLLQSFLRIISQLSNNCKIIMTSHSPYIIQYLEPTSLYIGYPNKNGIASFSTIKSSLVNNMMSTAKSYDMSIGDYIFQMLSENMYENNELNEYLNLKDNKYNMSGD